MVMSSPPAPPAKKRKMNFSEREVEIIVEELERSKHLLINHFNAGVPLTIKAAAWHNILRRVNAVATCHRELPEVKKKWSDLKTEVRRKVAQVRAAVEGGGDGQDGGGDVQDVEDDPTGATAAPVILTPMQQRICNLLGEATIISLPAAGCTTAHASEMPITAAATTVTLTQSISRDLLLKAFRIGAKEVVSYDSLVQLPMLKHHHPNFQIAKGIVSKPGPPFLDSLKSGLLSSAKLSSPSKP